VGLAYRRPKTAEDLKKHAFDKALLRYGLKLTDYQYKALVCQIRSRSATLLRKFSNNRSCHEVEIQGQVCVVVYNRKLGAISTFLCRRQVPRKTVIAA
jgi:hypothetical protein